MLEVFRGIKLGYKKIHNSGTEEKRKKEKDKIIYQKDN